MFQNLVSTVTGDDSPSSNQNIPTTDNFSATAERLKSEFSAEPEPGSAPEVLPPAEPMPDVVFVGNVERMYRVFFDGMRARYGDRWEIDDLECKFHASLCAGSLNELMPLFLASSRFKMTAAWVMATALMVGSRTDAGVVLVEKLSAMLSKIGEMLFSKPAQQQKPEGTN